MTNYIKTKPFQSYTVISKAYLVNSSPVFLVFFQHSRPQHVHYFWKLLVHECGPEIKQKIRKAHLKRLFILEVCVTVDKYKHKIRLRGRKDTNQASKSPPLAQRSPPLTVQTVPMGHRWWLLELQTQFLYSSSQHWFCKNEIKTQHPFSKVKHPLFRLIIR